MGIPHSQAVAGSVTAAGNLRVCQHEAYRMTCEDFDALERRSAGKCEICGTDKTRLYIDHDHSLGWGFPRGHVCPKCNAHMRRVDSGECQVDERVARFLEQAFWKTRHLLD